MSLLRKLRDIPKIKKVFIRSGIRFDYVLADKDDTFLNELCQHHISGQLRVAPEHISDNVLKRMGKPSNSVYQEFIKKFDQANKKTGKEQFIVPYLMSSHPGSTMKEAIELAEYIRNLGYMPEQVQDFYPTPSTISTCMYYTGYDPRTMEKVYTPVTFHEKALQRALIQYKKPENYELVKEALLENNRQDLIGFEKHCLIPPRKFKNSNYKESKSTNDGATYRSDTRSDARNNTRSNAKNDTRSNIKNDTRSNTKNDSRSNAKNDSRSNTVGKTKNNIMNNYNSKVEPKYSKKK